MPEVLSLMCVHAHPDDESSSTGGTLAKYAAENVLTSLITATKGEEGEIRDPNLRMMPWETLGMVRQKELTLATGVLKVGFVNFLGYRDSGMAGTEANHHSDAFCNADIEFATRLLVLNIRKLRPQVLITYNENGGYGHPDHIMCNRVTQAAFELAADPDFAWDDGEQPWQPLKLYYIAHSRERQQAAADALKARGLEDLIPGRRNYERLGYSDADITTRIDISDYLQIKRKALLCHKSQITGGRWERMPDDVMREFYAEETYIRAISLVDAPAKETDLFAGLRDRAVPADDYSLLFAQPVGTHFVA
ncbi:MAG TPA: PIG-L family deacetylase [Chloroflexota bacterium]|nr:PIG-L family deacetylase [Chloroflexota bacterium]